MAALEKLEEGTDVDDVDVRVDEVEGRLDDRDDDEDDVEVLLRAEENDVPNVIVPIFRVRHEKCIQVVQLTRYSGIKPRRRGECCACWRRRNDNLCAGASSDASWYA